MENKIYLLNAFSLSMLAPSAFEGGTAKIKVKPIGPEEARELLTKFGFVSAIGHESTASFLSRLLGLPVPYNRVVVQLGRGDSAVIFQLLGRLPEGKVLTEQELATIRYQFFHLEIEESE